MKITLHPRSLHFSILFFLVLSNLFSNMAYAQKKPNFIVLSGKITNVQTQPDGKKTIELNFPFGIQRASKTINLKSDGSFRDTVPNLTGIYILFDEKRPVYLYMQASKKYNIVYDVNDFKTKGALLTGDDVGINRYYIEKAQQRVMFDPSGEGKSESEFRQFAVNLQTTALKRLNSYILPKALAANEKKSINYEYLFNQYLFIALRELEDTSFKASPITLKEFAIDYNNEKDYKQYSFYQRMVYEYYIKRIRELNKPLSKKDPSYSSAQNRINQLAAIVPNTYIKNHLIAQVAMFDMKAARDLETFYTDFKKHYTGNDEKFKKSIANAYQRLVKLKIGTPSPTFVDYANHKGGTNSLNDFKGKYVYIDLWATWCGNCITEIPYLKKLEKAYETKPIVFLSISLDKDAKEWDKMIKAEMMPGIQLLVKQPEGNFIKEYAVNGIPRYIFLDPDGKIIAYNAPRPSDQEKLKALFESVGL